MLESAVEEQLVARVEFVGGLCEKLTTPGRRGVPDRLVTWWREIHLIETKAPSKEPRVNQMVDHARRRRMTKVFVLDTIEKVDEYVNSMYASWPINYGVKPGDYHL